MYYKILHITSLQFFIFQGVFSTENNDCEHKMDINETTSNSTTVSWLPNTTMTTTSISAVHSYPVRVVLGVCFILISVTSITGNSMVILAVIFSKKLRTSTNVFVVSLSSADLMTGLAMPMSAVALISPGNSWPWSTEAPCYNAGLLLYTICESLLIVSPIYIGITISYNALYKWKLLLLLLFDFIMDETYCISYAQYTPDGS